MVSIKSTVGKGVANAAAAVNKPLLAKAGTLGSSAFHQIGGLTGLVGVGGFYLDYKDARETGSGVTTSAFKAGVSNIAWNMAPFLAGTAMLAPVAYQGAKAAYDWRKQKTQSLFDMKHPTGMVGGNYRDTQQAQTMRQAALQQIQGNKLNARSALGGEARIFSNNYYR